MAKETIVYITRDIDRAIGMPVGEGYRIISNRTSYGETLAKEHPGLVDLVDSGSPDSASTGELIRNAKTQEIIDGITTSTGVKPHILVFKNTERIEPLAQEKAWSIINPPAATSEKIENKISQITWLADLGSKYLPPHRIELMKNVSFDGKPFILQWAHGHTGGGTVLITSEKDLSALKTRFPDRRCRMTDYVEGASYTINVVVTPEKILTGSPSYQITGLAPFTESKFATVGNDWGLADKLLTSEDKQTIRDIADELGSRMQKESWRGLFGIDLIKDAKTGKFFLIEINARQPASAVFESHLQELKRSEGVTGPTTFEAHIDALLGKPVLQPLIEVTDGAQIIQRVTRSVKDIPPDAVRTLENSGLATLSYENRAYNADLIRIQSKESIMSGHNEFNATGRKILDALKRS